MKHTTWKTLAIIFGILFILETCFIIFSVKISIDEENKTHECYYDVCEEYPDAWYDDGICYCYDYDSEGNLEVERTKSLR